MGWKIGPKAHPEFIAHLLKLRGLEDIAYVSTAPQINNKHIEPIVFPIPPRDEQSEIIKYLNHRTNQVDALMAKEGVASGVQCTSLIGASGRISKSAIRKLSEILSEKDRKRLLNDLGLAPAWMRPILKAVATGKEPAQ